MKCAAYCGTRNIYADMERSARSLIANSDVDKVYFFIEDDEFPSELPSIIECRNVSGQTFFPKGNANDKTKYTYMAMMRAALCHLLTECDKVLSLDCDTIAVKDCSGVWDIDVSDSYFAASPERWAEGRPGLIYCNIGVCLFNLDRLRNGKADEVIETLNRQYLRWVDQDAFNYLCQGRITIMDSVYNYCPFTVEAIGEARIIHYAGRNNFREETEVLIYRDMTWGEVMSRHERI